jgi:hypothetical protein
LDLQQGATKVIGFAMELAIATMIVGLGTWSTFGI